MSTLNTSDIESITVIKDAAAASLYGSRQQMALSLLLRNKEKQVNRSLN